MLGLVSLFLVTVVLLVFPTMSQNVNPAHPAEIGVQKHVSPDEMRERAANAQLQKDAKELNALCTAVSGDMDGIQHGDMSKDLLDRLKRMEKLSKHMREQLSRGGIAP